MGNLESDIQRKIIKRFTNQGFMVVKMVLTNCNGFPDLMLLKNGKTIFVEVKRPNEKPRPLQQYRLSQLEKLGFNVMILSE